MMVFKNLLEGVKNAVNLYPERPALVFPGKVLTYQELFNEARHWATLLLKDSKRKRLDRVAVFSYRNAPGYIGTLAALMTDAEFIPLNPRFPTERNVSILKECKPDAIIVDNTAIKELISISQYMELPQSILFPGKSADAYLESGIRFIVPEMENVETEFEFPEIKREDLAYILFTSGSTGQPKGVPITHANVCSFLAYNQARYQITPEDRLSQTFEQTFDLSVFDIFMAWCHGAALYAMRPIDLLSPSKYINDNQITVWFSVPSIITLLNKQGFLKSNIFPSLRLSLFCGEPLWETDALLWSEAAPHSICENLYGPTELTIACTAYRWERGLNTLSHNGILSIGKLYDHLGYLLINEEYELVTEEGELCVTGEQRFDGYLNTENQKKPYFIQHPDSSGKLLTYYRTGDRVRIDASGNILYLGRIDQQVKINGYRVELGEIESVLGSIQGVEKALVFCLSTEEARDNKKLVTYVVGNISPDIIIQEARKKLPAYMVPSIVKIEQSVPLNANGKIDRKLIASTLAAEIPFREASGIA